MSIRARIFFVFVAAVIAGFALLALWISSDVADRYSESFEEVMVDTANLLAEIITSDMTNGDVSLQQLDNAFQRLQLRRFSAQIYELEKTSVDIHVYVTDEKGIVVFDTDNGNAVGEDYSEWRDVHLTLSGEYGARATRVPGEISAGDPSQQLTIAYVAAPIYRQDQIIGVVTVAKPKNNIDRYVANAKSNLLLAVLFSVIIVLLLGLMLYIWVSRPLQALVDYAHNVSKGERTNLPQLGNNEIGKVGEAMDDMRQALEDKQYVERYVQSLTHEIKSPLTAIHAAAELLSRELPAEKRIQFADTIVKETDRLNSFASQLLLLAALEKRQRIDNPELIDLEIIVKEIVDSHVIECESRNLVVTRKQVENQKVYGDLFLIRQAIDNLFRNAIDFSPAGGKIWVDIYPQDNSAAIDIIDEGPGIADYVRERVFERFFSLPRPDTGRKSTGLGLNFAQEVAKLHDGELVLENRQPGLCARLLLPTGKS
ncbi:MAG: two-component system sensor histidine kinase CreC [Gammaproteobacteria bacterium]